MHELSTVDVCCEVRLTPVGFLACARKVYGESTALAVEWRLARVRWYEGASSTALAELAVTP